MNNHDSASSMLHGKRLLLLFPHIIMKGGALLYTFKLAEFLRERGATVAILTLCHDRKRYPPMDGIEILSLDGPVTSSLAYWLFMPLWQVRLHRQISGWQPDVIVPQVFPANWWGWLYKLLHRNTRLVWICQEPSAFIHSRPWIAALRPWWKNILARLLQPILSVVDSALCGYSDRIIANSTFTSIAVETVYGRKADAIGYPGLDFHAFNTGNAVKHDELITVARLTKFKRVDFLLRVFALVLKKRPELAYHIVGTGEELPSLMLLAHELGLDSRVIFHGAVDDARLAELYRRSKIFLHGSLDEPFGLAPVEAIACGAAVVAHNSGGLREFVNEADGRLVGSLSESAWCEEIDSLLAFMDKQPDFCRQIPLQAGKFSWENTLMPIALVIEDVLMLKQCPHSEVVT